MMSRVLLLFLFQSLIFCAVGHSWLGCSDYRGPVDFYDDTKCFGYPRYWQTQRSAFLTPQANGYELGGDSGYNYQPGAPCNLPMASPWQSAYTTDYPSAVYEQGQIYCLAWPTKNHVAAQCTNQYIPDTRMTIFRTDANPTADPTAQTVFSANEVSHNFGVHANGVIDCLGYQRSPSFCSNTDKALATGCIQIPNNMPLGHYVFQWYWIFNPGSPYTTCWDAQVVAPGAGRGGGGLIGADTVADNLNGGGGSICRTNWASQAFSIPNAGSPTSSPTSSSPTSSSPTSSSPASSATTSSVTVPVVLPTTDYVQFKSFPPQINYRADTTFDVVIEYYALARRAITVDILNLDTNPSWYGKGFAWVEATSPGTTPRTVKIRLTVNRDMPKLNNFLLRAWIVAEEYYLPWEQCNFCDTVQPWTEELDRRDQGFVVGDSTITSASTSGGGDGDYTAGDIAGTFFGTFLIMLLIFAVIYFVFIRPKLNATK